LLLAGIALLASAVARFDLLGLQDRAELRKALTQRGRVVVCDGERLSLEDAQTLDPTRTQFVSEASVSGLSAALAAGDGVGVAKLLDAASVDALLLSPDLRAKPSESVRLRLAGLGHVAGLRGVYLSRRAALYAPDPALQLTDSDRLALTTVARGLLAGKKLPRLSSFPPALRRVQPVEVMVLLRKDEKPRLWRSARGSSLARALMTAATVARQRWIEREQAMGASIDEALPGLHVEVTLLGDDGTVGERDPGFINRVFGPEHGVGYEHRGAWRYLLPDATRQRGQGSAVAAYQALLQDDGLSEESLARDELRLYRLFVSTLGVSEPLKPKDDGLGAVQDPVEVLTPQAALPPETKPP
jgi:hypothetical protein